MGLSQSRIDHGVNNPMTMANNDGTRTKPSSFNPKYKVKACGDRKPACSNRSCIPAFLSSAFGAMDLPIDCRKLLLADASFLLRLIVIVLRGNIGCLGMLQLYV